MTGVWWRFALLPAETPGLHLITSDGFWLRVTDRLWWLAERRTW